MGGYMVIPEDTVEIRGLSVVLEAEQDPPYLELQIRCGGQAFRALILTEGQEWSLRLLTEDGDIATTSSEPFLTQHAAVYAAILAALDAGLHPA